MQRAGLGDAPRTLLEEFAKIRSGDVVLQAQSHLGGPSRTIRLRWYRSQTRPKKSCSHALD